MTTNSTSDADRVADACRLCLGDPETYETPDGYAGLALCVIDSIWSMGVRYAGVGNVLDRYRSWVHDRGGDPEARTASQLVQDVAAVGGAEAFAEAVGNRQRTSARSGVLKSEAVLQAASRLSGLGIETTDQLRARAGDPDVAGAWLSVTGQGSGISFRYVTMLAGVEDVKPDRMICGFVADALGVSPKEVSPDRARAAVLGAFEALKEECPTLTVRALDHQIWAFQRGGGGAAPATTVSFGADAWSLAALRIQLDRYEAELRAANMADNTVQTYVSHPARFLRWLEGGYAVPSP